MRKPSSTLARVRVSALIWSREVMRRVGSSRGESAVFQLTYAPDSEMRRVIHMYWPRPKETLSGSLNRATAFAEWWGRAM